MRRKEVIRKIGELMTLRMAVNTRGGGLDDTPEVSCNRRRRGVAQLADLGSSIGQSQNLNVSQMSLPFTASHGLTFSVL